MIMGLDTSREWLDKEVFRAFVDVFDQTKEVRDTVGEVESDSPSELAGSKVRASHKQQNTTSPCIKT